MKYESFFIENYRGIKNRLDFNLDMKIKAPHCIIGNNESGKTTILKGIELISKLCEGETIENGVRKAIKPKGDYFSGVVKLGAILSFLQSAVKDNEKLSKYLKSTGEISISLEFSYQFERASFVEGSNEVNINFDGSLITEEEDKSEIFALISKYAPDVIYYDDFKFVVPKAIRFLEAGKPTNDKTYLERDENKHWQKIFTDILKGHDPDNADTFQKDVVDWYKDPNNEANIADSRLRNMGKYLDKILKEWIDNNKNNIEGFEISKKQPEKEADKIFNDYQISIISGNNSYQMNERSKGLQWSFCFHILTRIRKNRHRAGFIFLLDEPANNLHIRPQNEMLNHLNELCDGNSSVIYSTHSPELIGTSNQCYKHTFIAKNNADELQDTDIHLYELTEANKDVDVQDIEPILAKLAYEDIKLLSDPKKKNEKEKLKSIIDS
ncbi:AAA family ATPase, partial [Flavobacteriaceae bacterium]|nr:AAA family ATPase [Flavobacteriaceae bacterium]